MDKKKIEDIINEKIFELCLHKYYECDILRKQLKAKDEEIIRLKKMLVRRDIDIILSEIEKGILK